MRGNGKLAVVAVLLVAFVSAGSATVQSCDSLTFSSDADRYDGELLTCAFTSDFNTDSLVLDYPRTELSDKFPNGEADQGLEVSVTQQESRAVYGFRQTGQEPVSYFDYYEDMVDVSCLDGTNVVKEKIEKHLRDNTDIYDIDGSGGISTGDYYGARAITWNGCEYRVGYVEMGEQLASVGQISSSPDIVWSTEWTYSAGEKSYSTTVSNGEVGDQETTQLGDYGTVQWTGNKRGGDIAPSPTDEMIAHTNNPSNVGWSQSLQVIDSNNYDQWQDSISGISPLLEKRVKDEITTDDAVTEAVDNLADEAVRPHSSSELMPDENKKVSDLGYSGDGLSGGTLDLSMNQIAFPSFQVYFDVCQYLPTDTSCDSLITVQKDVGIPQIDGLSSEKFSELGSGTIDARISNVGSARGSFSARVQNCGSDFAVSDSSHRFLLGEGQSTTETFTISLISTSSEQKTISSSCEVQVKELNTGETVTDSVEVTGEQQNECEPESESIKVKINDDGNTYDTVQRCSSDGLKTTQLLECGVDENAVREDGTWQCVQEGEPVNAWLIEDVDGEKSCVEHTYQVGNIPSDAFLEKSTCQDNIDDGETCLVNMDTPAGELKAVCVGEDTVNMAELVVILVAGLAGASAGFGIGRYVNGERRIQGRFRPVKSRGVSRRKRGSRISREAMAGAVAGLIIGAVLGWYLGLWGYAVAGGLLLLKFLAPI